MRWEALAARPVRYGMIGGGPGAFIGAVHRAAARLDGAWRLVAGAFSSDPERSRTHGVALGLDPERAYASWRDLLESEAQRPPDERIEAVVVVTPNHLHHAPARAALEAGFEVVCDKPLTTTVADADDLVRLTARHDRIFAVTYNYSGYPMVKEARERVRRGDLGEVRRVVVEYTQGWLRTLLEAEEHKQASWRADPAKAGPAAALGDIGTHAHHLAGYVTGMDPTQVFADLATHVDGRVLEDDASVLMRYPSGARGLLTATQIATGERNHLRLRVFGSEGTLDWCQERPDRLHLRAPSNVETVLHDGVEGLSERAAAHLRLPPGHPEGFIEAFANLYGNVAASVVARRSGESSERGDANGARPYADDVPTVEAGAAGVRFVDAAVRSAEAGAWTEIGRG